MFPFFLRGPFVIPHMFGLFPSLNFSSVASVHLHSSLSILLTLPYVRPCICTPHVSFSPSASIHTLLARTSYAKFLLLYTTCPFLTVYAWHTFLTWNNLDVTNLGFVLLPYHDIVNCTFHWASHVLPTWLPAS